MKLFIENVNPVEENAFLQVTNTQKCMLYKNIRITKKKITV